MSYTSLELTNITTYIWLIAIIAVAVIACFFGYKLLNAIPAKWLCDYDEEPDETVLGIRYTYKKSGILSSAFFAIISAGALLEFGLSFYTLFILLISFVLLLITLSDGKFTIIPDQFTIVLAVLAVGFSIYDLFAEQIFIKEWWSILVGAACGGGCLLLINLISILVFKKIGIGFGDIKMMFAIGAVFGFPRIFIVLLSSVIVAFLYVVFLLFKKIFTRSDDLGYFPFGPFICVAAVCNILLVKQIDLLLNMYISLMAG
jgi:prepilin signal peptidase PulO-like enzyme (type II secretory pathway)